MVVRYTWEARGLRTTGQPSSDPHARASWTVCTNRVRGTGTPRRSASRMVSDLSVTTFRAPASGRANLQIPSNRARSLESGRMTWSVTGMSRSTFRRRTASTMVLTNSCGSRSGAGYSNRSSTYRDRNAGLRGSESAAITRQPWRPSERTMAIALPRRASVTRIVGPLRLTRGILYFHHLSVVGATETFDHLGNSQGYLVLRPAGVNHGKVRDHGAHLQILLPPVFECSQGSFPLPREQDFSRRVEKDDEIRLRI